MQVVGVCVRGRGWGGGFDMSSKILKALSYRMEGVGLGSAVTIFEKSVFPAYDAALPPREIKDSRARSASEKKTLTVRNN
jgi:hypothetical protein